MTQINLENPRVERFLADYARKHGIGIEGAIEMLAMEHLQRSEVGAPEVAETVDPETDPVILLMNKWLAEVPTDPEELRKNDEELREFMNQLNQNRIDAGEDPLF